MSKVKESENQPVSQSVKSEVTVSTTSMSNIHPWLENSLTWLQKWPVTARLQALWQWCWRLRAHHLAWGLVATILCFSLFALYRPVDAVQYQRVIALAEQTHYMNTQKMAQQILSLPATMIRQKHWLQLNAALQVEAARIRHYTPLHVQPTPTQFEYPDHE